MRRLIVVAAVVAGVLLAPGVARAQGGTFTTADGPTCTYTGFGGSYQVDCSGYSFRARRFVMFSCTYYIQGGSSQYWCRDTLNGTTWSGRS